MTIKEISINFREGRIISKKDNGIPFDMTITGKPTMDDLIDELSMIVHFELLYERKGFTDFWTGAPCDHPDCPDHPYTWGKTQEELDKTYEKDFNKYYEMDKLNKNGI